MLTLAAAPPPLAIAAAAAALSLSAASPSALQANGANAAAVVAPLAGASVAAGEGGASIGALATIGGATTKATAFIAASGPTTIDCSAANTFAFTLTGATTFNFVNWPAAGRDQRVVVYLAQDATGSRTASFAGVKYPDGAALELSTSADAIDCFVFDCFDGGTIYGNMVGGSYA